MGDLPGIFEILRQFNPALIAVLSKLPMLATGLKHSEEAIPWAIYGKHRYNSLLL
jgi:hypothetical protein